MRVIHLADFGGPYAGSFIPMLRAYIRAAQARGWQAEVVFAPIARGRAWLPELESHGIRVRFAPATSRRQVSRWLRQLLAESDSPTVLHTHFTAFDVPAVTAARKRPATAVFWHIHSVARPELPATARNILKYSVFGRRVEAVLCVSPHIAESVKRRLAPRQKVMVFPNLIDIDRFPVATTQQRKAARGALGLPSDRPVLVHFGYNWRLKGGDLFLHAAKLLRDRWDLDPVAVTVGGGTDARALSERLGLQGVARVLDPVERVQDVYAAANLFAAPSRDEGGSPPNAVAEALSSGVPVVASDIDAHHAVGNELAACRLVALEPRAIAEAIVSLLARDPDTAAGETAAARAWVYENRGFGNWPQHLVELHEKALSRLA